MALVVRVVLPMAVGVAATNICACMRHAVLASAGIRAAMPIAIEAAAPRANECKHHQHKYCQPCRHGGTTTAGAQPRSTASAAPPITTSAVLATARGAPLALVPARAAWPDAIARLGLVRLLCHMSAARRCARTCEHSVRTTTGHGVATRLGCGGRRAQPRGIAHAPCRLQPSAPRMRHA